MLDQVGVARVCVFCGSSPGRSPAYAAAARELGAALAGQGLGVVYGGGAVGLMGIVADAALAAGGEVIGVIPEALQAKEIGHVGVTDLRVMRSMHERKALMADLSDAFVALPGGLGTFEELCEMLTWAQLGEHRKPVVILDVDGFYEPLFALFDRAVEERFLRTEHRALAQRARSVDEVLALMHEPAVPVLAKWIDRDET
jgi:uncharacterized protein (TIGR00730 family)